MIKLPINTIQRCIDCDGSTALPAGEDGEDGLYGAYSLRWKFDAASIIATPGAQYVRFNSATYSSVTSIFISDTSNDSVNAEAFLESFDDLGYASNRGYIKIFKEYDSTKYWMGKVVSIVDNGADHTITVVYISHNSTFATNDKIVVSFVPFGSAGSNGSAGADGADGADGIDGVGYDSTTSSTSLTIGTGVQALTITTGKAFIANASRVRIANSATNYMDGVMTAYNSGSGVASVTVDRVGGSGTYSSWNISIIGDTPTSDTGWLDLAGFTHYSGQKPQYRVINKTIHFKGTCVIPLAADDLNPSTGGVTTYSGGTSYTVARVQPYTGAGGVTVNGSYSLTMNNGTTVVNAAYLPDGSYSTGYIVALRTIVDSTAADYLPYTAMLYITINASGQMIISTVYDQEDAGTNSIGSSPLRFLTSNVVTNDYILDYRVVDPATGVDTLHGVTAAGNLTYIIKRNTTPLKHAVTMDAGVASNIGGFSFLLDGLTANIA